MSKDTFIYGARPRWPWHPMEFFDTHAHLDDEQFHADRAGLVARALAAGVTGITCVGTSLASSQAGVALAEQYAGIYAAVGIHPNHSHEVQPGEWDGIVALANSASQPNSRIVALGETGLDRHWDFAPFALQQDYFARHLELSHVTGLPFITHVRECAADVLAMLREAARKSANGQLSGIIHSFVEDAAFAEECLALGLHISFSGIVTYKKNDELRQVAKSIPADRLLIETDAPYLSPHPKRGVRPNEPALVIHTAQCLADVRGVSLAELAGQTTANARKLFGLTSG